MKNVFFFGLIVSMKLMIMNKNKILFLKSLAFLLITIVFMSCTNESQIDSEHKDSQEKIVPKVPKPEYMLESGRILKMPTFLLSS